jgi:hypothetical protein
MSARRAGNSDVALPKEKKNLGPRIRRLSTQRVPLIYGLCPTIMLDRPTRIICNFCNM